MYLSCFTAIAPAVFSGTSLSLGCAQEATSRDSGVLPMAMEFLNFVRAQSVPQAQPVPAQDPSPSHLAAALVIGHLSRSSSGSSNASTKISCEAPVCCPSATNGLPSGLLHCTQVHRKLTESNQLPASQSIATPRGMRGLSVSHARLHHSRDRLLLLFRPRCLHEPSLCWVL